MKKRLLLLITCTMLTAPFVHGKSLVLTLTDGTLVYYLLGGDVNPMMYLTDEGVQVNADTYTFGNVKNFYISLTDDPSGIEHQLTEARVSYRNNMLVCTADDAGKVQVWSAGGTRVKADIKAEGGMALIDLSSLPQGAYVVKTGKSTVKVMVK